MNEVDVVVLRDLMMLKELMEESVDGDVCWEDVLIEYSEGGW